MRDKIIAALKDSWTRDRGDRKSLHSMVSRMHNWNADAWATCLADELLPTLPAPAAPAVAKASVPAPEPTPAAVEKLAEEKPIRRRRSARPV